MEVLVVRAGALGDVLLLRPTLAALRAAGHRPWLTAPASPGAALVGPGGSEAEGLLPWDAPRMSALASAEADLPAALIARLAAFPLALVFSRNAGLALQLRRVIPRVITRDPQPPPAGPHAARWLAGALDEAGIAHADSVPPLASTVEEDEDARRRIDALPPAFLAIHPGSGSTAKNWPAERFAQVAERRAGGGRWLLVEGPADAAASATLASRDDVLVARGWPVRVLAAALARAGLFVGNDSGVSHLAGAAGAPTIALYGPTDPGLWSPVGPRVSVVRSPDGTMAGLSVETVLTAARRVE